MKTTLFLYCLLISFTIFSQSSTLIVPNSNAGIFSKNSTPVGSDPGVIIQPPASGEGTRLMWIPAKSAFRAGTVNGTQWDAANIGLGSTAFGYLNTASGFASTALGYQTTASGYASIAMGVLTTTTVSGQYSIAMGYKSTVSGVASTALGYGTIASGFVSTALGDYTTASGNFSATLGRLTTAQAQSSLVTGRYNIIAGTADAWVSADPLFVIGNGTADNARSNAVTVLKNGKMGIGTPTPDAPLHVTQTSGAFTTDSVSRAYFNTATGTDIAQDTSSSELITVHAEGYYWADGGGFVATSDARIKNIIGRTNTTDDLDKLRKIAVTDYKYIDQVNNGSRLQKKVIAQQLKEVFPMAVNQNKGIIPNVYQIAEKAVIVGNTTQISMSNAHDLTTGDAVKLIVDKEGEKILDVTVLDSCTFSVAQVLNNQVFVYGKQVNDLLNVDYDAVSMLNVSATQELAKQVDVLKVENASLKNAMDELKSQIAALRSLMLKTDNEKEVDRISESKK